MMRSIPARPSLQYYRNEAKDLAKLVRGGDDAALARVRRQIPELFADSDSGPSVALHDAQRVLAREHGFASWPRFKRHLEGFAQAVIAVRQEGFALLDGMLDRVEAERLFAVCKKVLVRKNKRRTFLPIELHRRTPVRELLDRSNSSIRPIVGQAMEDQAVVTQLWIRGTFPGDRQLPIHRDRRKGQVISVDFLLSDFREETGATEIWPGSHVIPDRDVEEIRRTQQRAEGLPSVTLVGEAGSVVIRDGRAWHRNGVNRSDEARLMLSVVYRRGEQMQQKTVRPRLPA